MKKDGQEVIVTIMKLFLKNIKDKYFQRLCTMHKYEFKEDNDDGESISLS